MVTQATDGPNLPPASPLDPARPGMGAPELNPRAADIVCSGDPFDDFEDDDFDDEFDDDFEEEWDDDLGDSEYADEFPPDDEDEAGGKFRDDPDFDE